MGFWGRSDTTVPPLSNTDDPTMALDTNSAPGGWYYNTARNTTQMFSRINRCERVPLPSADWRISEFSSTLDCTKLVDCGHDTDVVECLFDGGHTCISDYQSIPLLDFIHSHKRNLINSNGATTTLAPTGATTTTMAPTVRESCACSAGYPYCWPDDQHCYRSASSGEWSDTLCAGSCTSSLAGCGATPPVEPGSTWQFTQTFAGGYQPNLIVSWLCTVSVTVCQQLDLSC